MLFELSGLCGLFCLLLCDACLLLSGALCGRATGPDFPSLALHKGELQRHAMMLEPGVSEISFGLQVGESVIGSLIGPRRMEGEKHSLITEVSVSDFCHEYHKHASPFLQ